MALEPIFEVEFHEHSYGFRPNRSAHHAVARCRYTALAGFTWIIEGDVKACFDEISHKAILRCIKEKVIDNKFLALIQLLLKAGVEIDGVVHPTTKGVPQGGVASPLLANIVLNKLDWFLHSKGFHDKAGRTSGTPQRCQMSGSAAMPTIGACFSHDASRERAERLRDEIRDFLRETCGLELSAEKTRITHVRDGYDFLGFNISVDVGKSGNLVAQSQGRPQGNHQHPDTDWAKPFAIAQCRKASRSVLTVLRQSFVAGRTTSRQPTTFHKLPTGWTTRLSGSR